MSFSTSLRGSVPEREETRSKKGAAKEDATAEEASADAERIGERR